MLKQRPTSHITSSNWYQVVAQVDHVQSHSRQSARDNIAELYDLHCCESTAELLEFIESHLAGKKYRFLVAEHVEGSVRGPNPTKRLSNAANEWLASTLHLSGQNSAVYLHQILSSGQLPRYVC